MNGWTAKTAPRRWPRERNEGLGDEDYDQRGDGRQRGAQGASGREIRRDWFVAEGDIHLPGQGEIPGRVGLEIAALEVEADAHGVRPQRRLAARHVLVVPGRAAGIGELGQVVRPGDPATLVGVEMRTSSGCLGEHEGERGDEQAAIAIVARWAFGRLMSLVWIRSRLYSATPTDAATYRGTPRDVRHHGRVAGQETSTGPRSGEDMETRASVVIIGAGIVGSAAAHFLSEMGWRDIVVVEQGPLFATGGSTSHAPGLVFQTNGSKTMTQFARETVELYASLEHDGQPCWYGVGSLEVATTPARWADLHRKLGWARSWGLDALVADPGRDQAPSSI